MAGHETPAGELEELTENVGRLADRLQVVTDSLDAIGDDLNWLSRNPLRIEVEAVLVGGSLGLVGGHESDAGRLDASFRASSAASRVAKCLQQTLATISAEQLEALLVALDEVQGHLLQLTRGEVREALHAGKMLIEPMRSGCCDETTPMPVTDSESDSDSIVPTAGEVSTEATVATPPMASGHPGRLF